jgi:hypothetical protein
VTSVGSTVRDFFAHDDMTDAFSIASGRLRSLNEEKTERLRQETLRPERPRGPPRVQVVTSTRHVRRGSQLPVIEERPSRSKPPWVGMPEYHPPSRDRQMPGYAQSRLPSARQLQRLFR